MLAQPQPWLSPPSTSPRTVANVLKTEGWYSPKTTNYYIEYRIRRLRARVHRENIRTEDQNRPSLPQTL